MRQRWGLAVVLGGNDDAGHRLHRRDRVLTHGGLTRKHDSVRTIQHGVGHVGGLRAGRAGVFDHGVQHLGRHDHRLGVLAGDLNGALLHQRDVLQRDLNAQVTAGDHDRVEGQDDRLERVDGLWLLQLGDDRHAAADLVHDLVNELDVRRGAHEGQRDEVHAHLQGEAEVLAVLLAERRHRDVHPWQGHALVIGDRAALDDLADHVVILDSLADQRDLAVVDKQAVARLRVPGQALVGGGDAVVGALDVLHGDANGLAGRPVGLVLGEAAEADLRALQVGQDADRLPGFRRGVADPLVILLMISVFSVGKVQARDIHARVDQSANRILIGHSWAERTHDFCSSAHSSPE